MSERTIAIVEPNVTNGIVVNVEVVPNNWVNNDPTHLLEYTANEPAAIGWQVVNGTVIAPPIPSPTPVPTIEPADEL